MSNIYFNQLGYKVSDTAQNLYIIKDFQSHAGISADGVIGPITKAKMKFYNKNNFCPEVFEPIKPYVKYTDQQIENLCMYNLQGLGKNFNFWSKNYDFDVLHNLAHAILESNWGRSKIARDKHNLYGWAAYDNSAYDSAHGFMNELFCIEAWSKWFDETYLTSTGNQFRGNNEYCVNIVYASSGIAGINKSFIVKQLRKKLT